MTPPSKASLLQPDDADTQCYDIMRVPLAPLTPDFNKPSRTLSTASVDTKRWQYQHPGEPKPSPATPRALLQEPLPEQEEPEGAVPTHDQEEVQQAEPMEEEAEKCEAVEVAPSEAALAHAVGSVFPSYYSHYCGHAGMAHRQMSNVCKCQHPPKNPLHSF